jgi:LacI family transcriptional regulator
MAVKWKPLKKRTTLRDIAEAAGVSAVTVHKAIYSKNGISGATRTRVLEIAESMNYSVNAAASSLKRKALHIVVMLQSVSNPESYFFRQMWKGVGQAERDLIDYPIKITRLECGDDWRDQERLLQKLALRDDVDGVVLHCWDETKLNPIIDYLCEKGIPVVTSNSDAIGSRRVACVTASNERVGRLAAELMSGFLPQGGTVIVAGGRRTNPAADSRLGFKSWMKKYGAKFPIVEVFDNEGGKRFDEAFAETLKGCPDCRGVYAITSRDTYKVCRAAAAAGLSGKIRIVGSDVFEELVPWFEDGTLQATIWKDPQGQAKHAVLLLYRHLMERPAHHDPIKIGIVMRGNVEDYL